MKKQLNVFRHLDIVSALQYITDKASRFIKNISSKEDYTDEFNRRFGSIGKAKNVLGNRLLCNLKLPSGENVINGTKYDEISGSAYLLYWNSNNDHTLWEINCKGECSLILKSKYLELNKDYPVAEANFLIIQSEDDNTIIFTNGVSSTKHISKNISIDSHSFTSSCLQQQDMNEYFELAIRPPLDCPKPTIINATSGTNRICGTIKFRTQFVYFDGKKSTWSPISYPVIFQDTCLDDAIKCILLTFDVGSPFVEYINIAYSVCTSTTLVESNIDNTLQWYLYKTVNKYQKCYSPKINLCEVDCLKKYDLCTRPLAITIDDNKTEIEICIDSYCNPIDTTETDRNFWDVPLVSKAIGFQNDMLTLTNNKHGFDNFCNTNLNIRLNQKTPPDTCEFNPGCLRAEIFMVIHNSFGWGGLSGNNNQGCIQFIHNDDSQGQNVWGGYNSPNGTVAVEENVLNSYRQTTAVEGKFLGYMAGTDYYAYSTQGWVNSEGVFEPISTPTLNNNGDRNDFYDTIEDRFDAGWILVQRFLFDCLPKGRYIFRVSDHNTSHETANYQSTSTYIKGTTSFPQYDIYGSLLINQNSYVGTSKEIYIDLCENDSYNSIADDGKKILALEDLTRPRTDIGSLTNKPSKAYSFYLYEDEDCGHPIEMAFYRGVWPDNIFRTSIHAYGIITDHNGFGYISGVPAAINFNNNDLWDLLIPGFPGSGIVTFGVDILTGTPPFVITAYVEKPDGSCQSQFAFKEPVKANSFGIQSGVHYLTDSTIIDIEKYSECGHYRIHGRILDCDTGKGIQGITVLLERSNTAITDFDGNYTLYAHNRILANDPRDLPTVDNRPSGKMIITKYSGSCIIVNCIDCDACLPILGQIALYDCLDCINNDKEMGQVSVKILGYFDKGLKLGGKYQFGFKGFDNTKRETFVQTNDSNIITIPELGSTCLNASYELCWSFPLDIDIDRQLTHISFYRTKNMLFTPVFYGLSQNIEFVDICFEPSLEQNAAYIKICYLPTDQCNAIEDGGYSIAKGDQLVITHSQDGCNEETYIYAIVNQLEGCLFIKKEGTLNFTATACENVSLNESNASNERSFIRFEVRRPVVCTDKPIFYEMCGNIPLIERVINGKALWQPQQMSGCFDTFDTYWRLVGDINGFIYSETNSVSPNCGILCDDLGRKNIENPFAKQKWFHAQSMASDKYLAGTDFNGIANFSLNGAVKDYDYLLFGEIFITRQIGGIFFIIGEKNYGYTRIGEQKITINSQGQLVLDKSSVFSESEVGSPAYGIKQEDLLTVQFIDNNVYWVDAAKGAVVKSNIKSAADIGLNYMTGYFEQKIKYVNSLRKNRQKASMIAGYDPLKNEYLLTFIMNDNISNNDEDHININKSETIAYGTGEDDNLWSQFYSFIPQAYVRFDNYINGNSFIAIYNLPFVHNDKTNTIHCNFFNHQDNYYLDLVLNDEITIEKRLNRLEITSSKKVSVYDISSDCNLKSLVPDCSIKSYRCVFTYSYMGSICADPQKDVYSNNNISGKYLYIKIKGITPQLPNDISLIEAFYTPL